MKANELRIGNLITRKNKVLKVCIIQPDKILVSGYSWGKYFKCDEIEPILLTEEWLLKFGFEKVAVNYQKGWLLLWTYLKTGEIHFVLNEPNSNKIHITELKYVHQLQNLYFALTGEELVEQP